MTWTPRIVKVVKELYNYLEFRRVVKKESLDSPKWTKLKLRYDWLGRIYTVVNLPAEITNSPDFPNEARPSYVMDEVGPINDYLGTDLNLNELITVSFEPIKEVEGDSFLVVYYYLFRYFTIFWLVRNIVILISVLTGFLYKDFLIEWIKGFI